MPSLFKPIISTYCLPNGKHRTSDGKRVTSKTPGATKITRRSKKWYGRYADKFGNIQRVPLSESKETARRMLNKIVGDAEMASVGIEDPYAEHRGRPLLDHLEDYRRFLEGKGDDEQHVKKTISYCHAVLRGCRFETMSDLDGPAVVEFLAQLRQPSLHPLEFTKEWYTRDELSAALAIHPESVARMLSRAGLEGVGKGKARRYSQAIVQTLHERVGQGTSVTTCNNYLTAIKAFSKWLARHNRMDRDPLVYLAKQNADADVRHPRRVLTEETFGKFIDATAGGKPFRRLTGADRLVLYTLAANTGFRANELGSLTPMSFSLDATPPTVTVEAGYSKHRRKDVQPLRSDVAEMMRRYLVGRPKNKPVWPGTWKVDAAEMIRIDLAAAGIPYQDEQGRCFDFHSVRAQFISVLAAKASTRKLRKYWPVIRPSRSRWTITRIWMFSTCKALWTSCPGRRGNPKSKARTKPNRRNAIGLDLRLLAKLAPCPRLVTSRGIYWHFRELIKAGR